jgi:hypothetical protein
LTLHFPTKHLCLLSVKPRTAPMLCSPHISYWGVVEAALYCAHRMSTVLSCAFCEQEGHLAAPSPSLLRPRVARAPFVLNGPSKLARYLLSRGGLAWSPTAHVERPLLHRGGSVSTGDQPGHPSPPTALTP